MKKITEVASRGNRGVLVHDPLAATSGKGVNGWHGLVLNDWRLFADAFWRSRNCLTIIDECPDVFRDHRNEALPMLLRGRHITNGCGGHVVAMISQRTVLLDKTARGQASHLFAFTVDRKDSIALAEDWNCDELRDCYKLPPLHYYSLALHGRPKLCRLAL